MKKIADKKTSLIRLRCTPKEKAKIRGLAKIYADGNISWMILDWILNGRNRQFSKPLSYK